MKRTIIFGDIHGCLDEWKELLNLISATHEDHLISVGDMICRGPYSAQVLDFAMSLPNFTYILGNHELRFLDAWRQGHIPNTKPNDLNIVWQMSDHFETYMKFIDSKPLYLELPEAIVVHAGLRPGVPLLQQNSKDLTEIREVNGDRPWYEYYEESKPVVFGHWVRREPLVRDNAIGLDTGCVYGGKLSAYILPDQKIVNIPARKTYYLRSKSWA
jgi:serine/threonine protein phosphatase 1